MGRPSNTGLRRTQIVQGLIKVMARRGYDGASIADVAAAAKLTPGLVHYHFKDKREILLGALAELSGAHDLRLDAAFARAGHDPAKQVDAFIDAHLATGREADPQGLAVWILLSGEALRDPKVRAAHEQVLAASQRRLKVAIAKGVLQKQFKCADPDAAASALIATIHGYFALAATARGLIPPGSAAAATRKMAKGLLT